MIGGLDRGDSDDGTGSRDWTRRRSRDNLQLMRDCLSLLEQRTTLILIVPGDVEGLERVDAVIGASSSSDASCAHDELAGC